ncbi:hypothetical protein AVA65_08295 [Salmonella enterica subsp. enterica serovar Minnesota]|nr:hypothetical protein [Salmonella enterica subsp. enterica serovar Minnesota]
MSDEKDFDKENEDQQFSVVFRNQNGYTEDIYELLKGGLTDALLAYETAETCSYDNLDWDITKQIYDQRGRLAVSPRNDSYMRILKDDREWRDEMYTGTKFLIDHVLRENEGQLLAIYESYNIRDVQVPTVTQNRIVVLLSGLKK